MRSGLCRMELFGRRPCEGTKCLLTRRVERAAVAVVEGIVTCLSRGFLYRALSDLWIPSHTREKRSEGVQHGV